MEVARLVWAPRSRGARLAALALVAGVLAMATAYLALPLAIRGLITALDLLMRFGIWLASLGRSDQDVSTILWTVARAAIRALTSPEALVVLAGLVLVGGAALYGLQRLLGLESEGETSR
jgi:hypothetical protein